MTIVNCPEEMRDVRLAIGSNAASVWWVNGQEVIGIYGDRQTVIDDGVSKKLTLKKGPNVIRCAVHNRRHDRLLRPVSRRERQADNEPHYQSEQRHKLGLIPAEPVLEGLRQTAA